MSDYIMDLRKIVGHRPLLQIGASVIVEDEKGRILLQKRSDRRAPGTVRCIFRKRSALRLSQWRRGFQY